MPLTHFTLVISHSLSPRGYILLFSYVFNDYRCFEQVLLMMVVLCVSNVDRHLCSALGQMTFIPSHISKFLQPNLEDGFSFYMSTNSEKFRKSHLDRTCGALGLGQTFGQRGENDSFTHSPDFRENEDENQNSGIWVL